MASRGPVEERMLRESIRQYRRMVETSQDGILVFDPANILTFVNPRLAHMLGYTVDELMGKPLADLLVGNAPSDLTDQITRHRYGIAEENQFQFHHKDGGILWALIISNPLFNADGSYSGTRARVIDITALKRAEAEVEDLKEQLSRRDAVFEQRVQERTLYMEEFVATVSHEFRTPLTSVRGYLDLVLTDPDLPRDLQERYLHRMLINVQHLSSLLNNLLDLSRIASGNFSLELQPVIISDLLVQMKDAMRPQFEAKGVDLKLDVSEDLSSSDGALISDRESLIHILTNLLSNACNYTLSGGSVTLSAVRKGKNVTLGVKDTGIGIPESEQSRIFSKFYRGGNSRKLPTKGTGLGLAITKSLVDLMGGEIDFTSEEGKGTMFRVTLPLVPDPALYQMSEPLEPSPEEWHPNPRSRGH